jgi:integrase
LISIGGKSALLAKGGGEVVRSRGRLVAEATSPKGSGFTERALVAAAFDFPGAFHSFRFGCANVDSLAADLLQKLMRHQAASTTRRYIIGTSAVERCGGAGQRRGTTFRTP